MRHGGNASAATRAGARRRLHVAERGAPLAHRAADRADADGVAAAEQRGVGERPLVGWAHRRREEVRRQVVGLGGETERDRREEFVAGRVADEGAADQRAGGGVEREPAEDLVDRVVVDELVHAVARRIALAECRHVDTEQLELGRQVTPPIVVVTTDEAGRQRGRHLVPGRHQPVHPTIVERHLTDRPDVLDTRLQRVVDDDAATLADVDSRSACHLVAWAHTGGEHDDVTVVDRPVGHLQAASRCRMRRPGTGRGRRRSADRRRASRPSGRACGPRPRRAAAASGTAPSPRRGRRGRVP